MLARARPRRAGARHPLQPLPRAQRLRHYPLPGGEAPSGLPGQGAAPCARPHPECGPVRRVANRTPGGAVP
eukprot:15441093-Alexandrium_andersonii.AAC.1